MEDAMVKPCYCSEGGGIKISRWRRWLYVHLGIGRPNGYIRG